MSYEPGEEDDERIFHLETHPIREGEYITLTEPDGRQLHVELGTTSGQCYLYCANTFDQRQLVMMRMEQRRALEQYYVEILAQSP